MGDAVEHRIQSSPDAMAERPQQVGIRQARDLSVHQIDARRSRRAGTRPAAAKLRSTTARGSLGLIELRLFLQSIFGASEGPYSALTPMSEIDLLNTQMRLGFIGD